MLASCALACSSKCLSTLSRSVADAALLGEEEEESAAQAINEEVRRIIAYVPSSFVLFAFRSCVCVIIEEVEIT